MNHNFESINKQTKKTTTKTSTKYSICIARHLCITEHCMIDYNNKKKKVSNCVAIQFNLTGIFNYKIQL